MKEERTEAPVSGPRRGCPSESRRLFGVCDSNGSSDGIYAKHKGSNKARCMCFLEQLTYRINVAEIANKNREK